MSFNKKTIRDIEIVNKKVILRTTLNVPIENGKVVDTTRLEVAKRTIKYLTEHGAKLILISHHSDESQSFAPIAPVLSKIVGHHIDFVPDCVGPKAQAAIDSLVPGEIIMLENLRFHPEETSNEPEFAKKLASYGEVFVQDDFTACHREHASMVGIPKYLPSVAGLSLEYEVSSISKIIEHPKKPVIAVIGGAKISTKIPILSFLLDKVEAALVIGAMANTFLLAQGKPVGKSLVEPDQVDLANKIIKEAEKSDKQLLLPIDVVVATKLDPPENVRTVTPDQVGEDDIIADLGPETIGQLKKVIDPHGSVIWNGPAGIFETAEFAVGTKLLAKEIINSGAYSLVGGGDTLSFVDQNHLQSKFDFVSTGGGASMDMLSGKTLPGVEALEDK